MTSLERVAGDPITLRSLPLASRREYKRLAAALGSRHPALTGVRVERDIAVPASDGAALLSDHWSPEGRASGVTIVIRTPYGRANAGAVPLLFAERGHHVIVQSCRGTFGSGVGGSGSGVAGSRSGVGGSGSSVAGSGVGGSGRKGRGSGRTRDDFDPFHSEAADGAATLAWVRAQPWATGPVHTWGGSYVGLTQWAVIDAVPTADDVPAGMVIAVSARSFADDMIYIGGGFALDTGATWGYALDVQELPPLARIARLLLAPLRVRRAERSLPFERVVERATGRRTAFYEDWVRENDPDAAWWQPLRYARDLDRVPPVVLIAGWQDLFLLGGVADYRSLRDAGRDARLVIGDWSHGSPELGEAGVAEAVTQLTGAAAPRVSVEVTGGVGWVDLDDWPVAAREHVLTLGADATLRSEGESVLPGAVHYRYDPADPTPSLGGRTLYPFEVGRRRQHRRESRSDVVFFTGDALAADLTVAGAPTVRLSVTSSAASYDVFVRLCDVTPKGVSSAVSDGYVRLPVADPGVERTVEIALDPIAHRFAKGSRLRLQVSSAAHPLFARHPGTNDPLHGVNELVPSEQSVRLGGDPVASTLTLPIPVEPLRGRKRR